jgi:next-to-BRCA1 protein 1
MVGEDNVRTVAQDHATKTQVQTVAEVKPTECASKCVKEKIEIKDLIFDASEDKAPVANPKMSLREPVVASERELEALFVRDTITDGTTFEPEAQFVQVWTLTNPGPETWPAGCSVRYVGGDNMLNVNDNRPSSESDISKATESNIIRRAVPAGEEISFRVMMKAPKREGVAISYWRLKTADGIPFGHRLWCHINVAGRAVDAEQNDTREVGRLGAHDAFLRYSLTEQFKREETTGADATINEKLQNLRQALREHRAQNGLSLRDINNSEPVEAGPSKDSKVEKVKIEVVESNDKPVEKAAEEKVPQLLSFPTLDAQSPSSSAATEVATNAAVTENIPAVASAPAPVKIEIFDDAESIDLLDDSSSDDGFLTEDEYDILDASDEELA